MIIHEQQVNYRQSSERENTEALNIVNKRRVACRRRNSSFVCFVSTKKDARNFCFTLRHHFLYSAFVMLLVGLIGTVISDNQYEYRSGPFPVARSIYSSG